MATRAARVSPLHVEALNRIDIEFYGKRIFKFRRQSESERNVIDAWRIYLDHLNESIDDGTLRAWTEKGTELLVDLLFSMSKCVGYSFDKVHLKRGVYYPRGHGELEVDQQLIREDLVKILVGEKPLPVQLILEQDALMKQDALQGALFQQLTGKVPLKVQMVEGNAPGGVMSGLGATPTLSKPTD